MSFPSFPNNSSITHHRLGLFQAQQQQLLQLQLLHTVIFNLSKERKPKKPFQEVKVAHQNRDSSNLILNQEVASWVWPSKELATPKQSERKHDIIEHSA